MSSPGYAFYARDAKGRALPSDALTRFAAKCEFDPVTGCVLWRGGKTAGRGNTATYGSFWDQGRRWFAHRWAGIHIHGLDLATTQAGHCCPSGPNTLCVEHIIAQTQADNIAEMHDRKRVAQSSVERQYWLFVRLGIERAPDGPTVEPGDGVLFTRPPAWLRPFLVDDAVNSVQDNDNIPF